jgi:hypothetical protein
MRQSDFPTKDRAKREYFDKLFNDDSETSSIELDISSDDLKQTLCA